MTKSEKALIKNAEVTPRGVRRKGSASASKLVTGNQSPIGKLKRRIMYGGLSILATTNAYGIATDMEGIAQLHASYLLGIVFGVTALTFFFTKTE